MHAIFEKKKLTWSFFEPNREFNVSFSLFSYFEAFFSILTLTNLKNSHFRTFWLYQEKQFDSCDT